VVFELAVLELLVPPVDPPSPNPTVFLLGQSHRHRIDGLAIPQRVMPQHAFDLPVPRGPSNREPVERRNQRQHFDRRGSLEQAPAGAQYSFRRSSPPPQAACEQHMDHGYDWRSLLEYDYPPELPIPEHSERPGLPERPTV
jgi:hypothetical protein